MSLTRDNHYVPQLYLKNFCADSGEVFSYRLLVPNETVRVWDRFSVAGTGYQRNLYTRIERGKETDDIEQWLSREFETPAAGPLRKVLDDESLHEADWRALVRFLAAQIVRTPAFLIENLPIWNKMAPKILDEITADAQEKLAEAKKSGKKFIIEEVSNNTVFPLRVIREDFPEKEEVKFTTQVLVGRALWFFTMRHTLTKTLEILHQHRWTILTAPDGLPWFTSDDPVVRLNYRSEADYDFKGGWGRPGGNIFLPLSPRHLLFTEIGAAKVPRQTPKKYHARMIRRMIAEHAHRRIYSSLPDPKIPQFKPRVANLEQFNLEDALWDRWYEDQTKAELELHRDVREG
jgi:hypothetical protein